MTRIALGTLSISATGKRYVNEVLNENRLSYGSFTEKFETDFAKLHQAKHAIFMSSGTCALQVALAALKERHNYEDGAEVLVPSTTFIATSNAVLMLGLKPVFVDVCSDTFNVDPDKIAEKVTDKTVAIIPVHLFGLPANMPRIMSIAHYYGLNVLSDSCETMFAGINGKSVGSFGDMVCFSTYICHIISGGVGGLVTTNDDKYADMCRSLMAHGRDSIYTSIDADDGLEGSELSDIVSRRYRFERLGYSFRATQVEAALALSELEQWESNIATRRANAEKLTMLLKPFEDKLQLPVTPDGYENSRMMYPVVCKDGVDRELLLMHLEINGIETRYLFPLLSQPVYRKLFPGLEHKYPVSKMLSEKGFFIGMHQNLTAADMHFIAQTIAEGLCAQSQ